MRPLFEPLSRTLARVLVSRGFGPREATLWLRRPLEELDGATPEQRLQRAWAERDLARGWAEVIGVARRL